MPLSDKEVDEESADCAGLHGGNICESGVGSQESEQTNSVREETQPYRFALAPDSRLPTTSSTISEISRPVNPRRAR